MLSTAFYCVFQIAILFSFFTHIIYALQIIGWHSPGKYLPIILKSNFNFFSPKIKYAFIIYFNNKSSKMGEKRLNFWQSEKKWYRMTVWHIFFQLSFDNAQNGLLFFEICWLYVNKMSNRPLIEIKLCTLYHWMCGLVTHILTHIFLWNTCWCIRESISMVWRKKKIKIECSYVPFLIILIYIVMAFTYISGFTHI